MLVTLGYISSHVNLQMTKNGINSHITIKMNMKLVYVFCVIEIKQSSSDVPNEEVAADWDNLEISTATSHIYYGTIRIAQLTC